LIEVNTKTESFFTYIPKNQFCEYHSLEEARFELIILLQLIDKKQQDTFKFPLAPDRQELAHE
jgi:hypothetical protein